MARIVLGVALLGAPWATASAGTWDSLIFLDRTATITQTNRLCVGTGGATIACPTFAPSLTTAGDMTLGGLLTAPNANVTGDLHVGGNFYVSGSQSIDGVTFANGGIQAGGTVSATAFVGDGSGLTNVVAASSDRIISGTTQVIANNGGNIDFKTGSTLTGYYTPGGVLTSVGVSTTGTISGTTGYMHTLNVGDPGSPLLGMLNLRNALADLHISNTNNLWNFQAGIGDNTGIAFNASDQTNQLVVATNGYVGVGTRYPSGTLHVVNGQVLIGTNLSSLPLNPSASLYIGQSDDNVGGIVLQRAGGGTTGSMFMNSGARFVVQRGVAANLLMDTTGNLTVSKTLSVNTFSPSTTLDVSGSIRMKDGGEACDAYRVGAMKYTANEFYVCRNGTAWESLTAIAQTAAGAADRITSGTTSVLAISDTGLVSITQSGVNTAYFHPSLGLVTIGVSSTGRISATSGYLAQSLEIGDKLPAWMLGKGLYVDGWIATTAGLTFQQISAENGLAWLDGVAKIYSQPNNKNLIFYTSNTEAMRIVSSGYVGIGTDNPQDSLHVSGTMLIEGHQSLENAFLRVASSHGGSMIQGHQYGESYTNNLGIFQAITDNPTGTGNYFFRGLIGGRIGNTTTYIRADGQAYLAKSLMLGGGKLSSMDAVTPSVALDVSGTIRMADGGEACDAYRVGAMKYAGNEFYVCRNGTAWESLTAIAQAAAVNADRITSGTTYVVADGTTGLVSITQSGVNTAYFHPSLGLVTIGVSSTGSVNASNLQIHRYTSGASLATFRNETDTVDLSIDSSSTTNSIRLMGGSVDNLVLGTNGTEAIKMMGPLTGGNFIIFNASGTEAMRIVSSGYVGMGTSAPFSKLHVNGNMLVDGEIGRGMYWNGSTWVHSSSGIPGFVIRTTNTQDTNILSGATGAEGSPATGLWSPLYMDNTNKRLGVNLTVVPSTSLHVSGTIRMADGGEACDANRAGAIKYGGGNFYFCDGTTGWKTLGEVASLQSDRITSGTTSVLAISNTGLVSITQSGVNTAYFHPSLGLVAVGVSTTGMVSATGLYVGGNSTILNVTRYDGAVGSTGGVARFTLNTSGTFVNGTGPALTFSALSDMGRIGFYADSYDGTATSSRLGSFFVKNRNVLGSYLTNFVVNSNGFVGVGTTSPTARMDVSGSIKVSGENSDVCDDAHVGMIRRDPTTGHMQLCQ